MTGRDERAELKSGMALGPFRLGEKIATGGMAEIWTAKADGPVALKILLAQFASDPGFRAMFHDEVAIATRLDHPNIVRVHGAYDVGGHLFQAMELLEGLDLRRFLSLIARHESRAPVPLAIAVALGVARGLAHAHHLTNDQRRPLEIVHRDVSPHNIMITREGRVLLLDFGIARAAERLTRTRTGVIKGKVAYMAPEQALAVGVTPQTDIFAAGVVLWEMLAMRRLFRAATDAESIELVVRANVPSIRSFNAEVPDTLAELVHRMLALRAPDRPSSMKEVTQRLETILRESFPAAPTGPKAMAAWLAEHSAVDRADTLMLPTDPSDPTPSDPTDPSPSRDVGAITEPNPTPEPAPDAAPDPTDPEAAVDPSGPTGETPPQDTSSPTEAVPAIDVATQSVRAERVAQALSAPPVVLRSTTDPSSSEDARLPTQSEIIRAVESQATVPIHADARMLANLPEVIVSAPEPDDDERQTAPPDEIAPAPAPRPFVDPDDSSGAFERIVPVSSAPADAPAPVSEPPAEVVVPPEEETSWWLPATTALLAIVVVVLLILLLTRG